MSTKRLAPEAQGPAERDRLAARRLAGLALQVLGRILNLRHAPVPRNVMYDVESAEDLDPKRDNATSRP